MPDTEIAERRGPGFLRGLEELFLPRYHNRKMCNGMRKCENREFFLFIFLSFIDLVNYLHHENVSLSSQFPILAKILRCIY